MFKRAVALVVTAAMALGLAACNPSEFLKETAKAVSFFLVPNSACRPSLGRLIFLTVYWLFIL